MRALPLRARWVLTTAALVSVTGALAVVMTTIVTDHLLQSRSRGVFAPPPTVPGLPLGTAPAPVDAQARVRAQADAGHTIATHVIHDVRLWGAALVAGLVVLSIIAAWFVTGRMLRPLQDVVATAREVSTAGEGHRIGATGPHDELRELADTIDSMLDRIDASSAAQRQFVANASHELRTPLAAMAVEIDVALDHPDADQAELLEALRNMRVALDRSQQLVESLLLLARSGVVQHPVRYGLEDACERAISTARALHPDLAVQTALAPAPVMGDAALLDRLTANLVENAARYRAAGTPVSVASGTANGHSWLRVTNDFRAVTDGEVEDWFDRFKRGNRARSRDDGGAGLGLSIARSVAEAHGGTVAAKARADGGVVMEATFPRAHSEDPD